MKYIIILLIAILIILAFVLVLLFGSKSSNNISLFNSKLTIWYPLKKDVIDLKKDIISWHLQRLNLLRLGKINSLTLKLKSGEWKKVYSRSMEGQFGELVQILKTQEKD